MKPHTVLLIALWICTSCGSSSKSTDLHEAAEKGDIKAVKALLAAGAEINAKNSDGETPLHCAAWSGQAELAKILLQAGAGVNAKDKGGRTPLHSAAVLSHTETARELLCAGAEVNAKDDDGDTPLDKAKDKNGWADPEEKAKCAYLLLEHGAKTGAELDAEAKQRQTEKESIPTSRD